ncbi:uncharacterized protein LOC110109098 [Dendrobium catenatum]|uniref:uncharacterized protein LOC110109098 n=1 Tax=Dendrobium catenatum TaxID=906689 RepID=UPI0009F4BB03|nr:uncharacterized protein LOC110109098 [Dendrobium catenatum]
MVLLLLSLAYSSREGSTGFLPDVDGLRVDFQDLVDEFVEPQLGAGYQRRVVPALKCSINYRWLVIHYRGFVGAETSAFINYRWPVVHYRGFVGAETSALTCLPLTDKIPVLKIPCQAVDERHGFFMVSFLLLQVLYSGENCISIHKFIILAN